MAILETYLNIISIHAPHARSDPLVVIYALALEIFQSTLLMRGATWVCGLKLYNVGISIHAPHARSDWTARKSQDGK